MDGTDIGRAVVAAGCGDAVAWQVLVERFSTLVWPITRAYRLASADAADVCQTTWVSTRTVPSDDVALLERRPADDNPTDEAVLRAERERLPVGSIGPTRARCLERLRQELAGITERSTHS